MLDLSSSDPDPDRPHRPGAAGVMVLEDGTAHVVVVCQECGLAWPVAGVERATWTKGVRVLAGEVGVLLKRYRALLRSIRATPANPEWWQ